ncbi:DUF2919 family protein [Pseudidiomarina terrestris]|uniref:DUF2919 family protein n=1 Tax=Pseudidiomarina terrestris TaxID=2820060 RepID=A0AAW7QXK9_9GAMM|nr:MULTISPECIES: DUF2919 family protein [unclassified Pseudidiomarina]MDN7123482.1 DUF2919 family protein [Pseudidiomarina sp. 1APP75-32.1]MDN7126728.1 DUF2919 family protein [Pseudidiomarina sp. 1APR75-33.1]MDN7128793.1 DUF2919 family protein [Pseudidiomarina sp. 1APR75-15]MDN7134939.1 DUF2919 family protein [Pseudidiomarina sp. 1ASP75-5]MDN7137618.1 DUF2919 family protein [Pseudidiomarina sp. 1ASP75-14]
MQLQRGDEHYLTADGQLRTPLALIFVLGLFLRGYLAWIISLTFSEDRSRLLQFFYSNTEQFVLTLSVGLPALAVVVMLTQVKAEMPAWVPKFARIAPALLWLSWLADGVLIGSLVIANWPHFAFVKAFIIFAWLIALWLLLYSRHLKRFFELVAASD